MSGKILALALVALLTTATGCRMCDSCYPQGGLMTGGGCANGNCGAQAQPGVQYSTSANGQATTIPYTATEIQPTPVTR